MNKKPRGVEHRRLLSISSNYRFSLMRIREFKRKGVLSDSQKDILFLYEKYVQRIEQILSGFNMLESSILEREYFNPLPSGWWADVYPRSTFYRLRLTAERRFLSLF